MSIVSDDASVDLRRSALSRDCSGRPRRELVKPRSTCVAGERSTSAIHEAKPRAERKGRAVASDRVEVWAVVLTPPRTRVGTGALLVAPGDGHDEGSDEGRKDLSGRHFGQPSLAGNEVSRRTKDGLMPAWVAHPTWDRVGSRAFDLNVVVEIGSRKPSPGERGSSSFDWMDCASTRPMPKFPSTRQRRSG